jgi:putative transposase
MATRWLWTNNHEGPNIDLGGITPAQKRAMAARLVSTSEPR